jgi:hypothetical protein
MSYNLEWRDTATLTTTTVTGITDLFYDLTGLTAGTDYEFRVQEDDGTTVSGWSAWAGFTTATESIILYLDIIENQNISDSYKVVHTSRQSVVEDFSTQENYKRVHNTVQNVVEDFSTFDSPINKLLASAIVDTNINVTNINNQLNIISAFVSEIINNADNFIQKSTYFSRLLEDFSTQENYKRVHNTVQNVVEDFSSSESIKTKSHYSSSINESLKSSDVDTTDKLLAAILASTTHFTEDQKIRLDLVSSYVEALMMREDWAVLSHSLVNIIDDSQITDDYEAILIRLEQNIINEGSNNTDKFLAASTKLSFVKGDTSLAMTAIAVSTIVTKLQSSSNFSETINTLKSIVINTTESSNLQSVYNTTMTKILTFLFESYSTKVVIECERTSSALIQESFGLFDEYNFPNSIGFLSAVIFIKTYIDGNTSITTYLDTDKTKIN